MSRYLLFALGLISLANGAAMVCAPSVWYAATPGVADTGPANLHFIVDIGLAYAASGAGLMFALSRGAASAALVVAGAVWPGLHALFHLVEWSLDGPPPEFSAAATAVVGVIAPGALGLMLALRQLRRPRHIRSAASSC